MSTSIIESTLARDGRVQVPATEQTGAAWKLLYRIAAVVALLSVVFIVVAGVALVMNPIPTTMVGWFDLFNQSWLRGLLAADLIMLACYVLAGVIYVALYGALRRVNQPFMALGTALAFVGMVAYIAANPAFSMLSLSSQYADAPTGAERTALLGAGQAIIANWTGTAFNVAYFMGALFAIIVSIVMLRSNVFSKATGFAGLAMGVLTLVPASAGTVGIVFSLLALVPTMIWYVLLARRFFKFGSKART
jgi:hypothetical protein